MSFEKVDTPDGRLEYSALNQWQLDVLTNMAKADPTLVVLIPSPDDPIDVYSLRVISNKNTEELVNLNLIEDANDQGMFNMFISSVYSRLNRTCRVFRLTELGYKMFSETTKAVN